MSAAPRWVHWFHRDVCPDDDAYHAMTGATAACGKAVMSPPAMECTTDDSQVTCPRCWAVRRTASDPDAVPFIQDPASPSPRPASLCNCEDRKPPPSVRFSAHVYGCPQYRSGFEWGDPLLTPSAAK